MRRLLEAVRRTFYSAGVALRAREPDPDDRVPLTFHGETAYYSQRELEMLAALPATKENENAAEFIHACKVHLDATLSE